ncbi:sulfur carrier protein ThiS [Teichococcus cervicalis]
MSPSAGALRRGPRAAGPALLALALLALAGCSPSYSPDTYASRAVQQANKVEAGVVVGRRAVQISADGSTGAAAGAAAGGVAGTRVGGGDITSAFAGIGGGLIGGLLGAATEKGVGSTDGFEYIVRKPNGEMISVTQRDATPLDIGQKVLVIAGAQARIVPDYTVGDAPPGAAAAPAPAPGRPRRPAAQPPPRRPRPRRPCRRPPAPPRGGPGRGACRPRRSGDTAGPDPAAGADRHLSGAAGLPRPGPRNVTPGGAAMPPAPFPNRAARATFRRMAESIQITINGETRLIQTRATVADLLAVLSLDTRKVAVERNLEIVPRSAYAATALAQGDTLEIVHFIGGG